jgi:hypothetical protein
MEGCRQASVFSPGDQISESSSEALSRCSGIVRITVLLNQTACGFGFSTVHSLMIFFGWSFGYAFWIRQSIQ